MRMRMQWLLLLRLQAMWVVGLKAVLFLLLADQLVTQVLLVGASVNAASAAHQTAPICTGTVMLLLRRLLLLLLLLLLLG